MTPEAKSHLHVINKQLSLKSSYLNNLVLNLCEVSDIAGEVDEAENITAKIIEYQSKIELCVKLIVSEASDTPSVVSGPFASHPVIVPPTFVAQTSTCLPKLELPRFRGDLTTWTAFWDSFKASVLENPNISNIDKFNYLKSHLQCVV